MIETNFAGLALKSPIIVGSNSQTASIDKIIEFEGAGAGAVVLKSLFQESIEREIASAVSDEHPEANDYISAYVGARALEDYVNLIRTAKSRVSIPVIATGGAGTKEHFLEALTEGKADAALAASLFHYKELEIVDLKKYLREQGVPVRL